MIEIKIQIKEVGKVIKVRVACELNEPTKYEVAEGEAVMEGVKHHSRLVEEWCAKHGTDMFSVTGNKEQVGDLIKRRFEQE